MAETKTMNVRFQQKFDTAENWAKSELILLPGEMAVESDTGKFKFGGDGKKFSELDYAGIDQAQLDATNDSYYEVLPGSTEEGVLKSLDDIENPKKGDIAVVKANIGGEISSASSMTAYMYNGSTWQALDGNYNADNVYFDQDLITSFAMGNITLSNGMATIPAAGKNLSEVWQSIYVKETNTNLQNSAPSCSMSGNSTKYYLVGATSEAQTITLGLSKGSYDYGYGYVESKDETDPAAGTPAKVRVTNDGTGVVPVATSPYTLTWDGTAVSPTVTNGNVFSCSGLKKTSAPVQAQVVGKVKYEKAGNPVSNLGNIYPAQAYPDTTSGANTQTLARWYYPFYQGFTVDSDVIADPANITATQLEALNKANMTTYRFSDDAANTKDSDRPGTTKFVDANAYNKKKVTTATAASAWRQYFLAYPKDYSFDMSAAKDSNNIDCTVRQAADVTLTFNGVDVVYAVYYINNATPYGTKTISWTLN